MQVEPQAKNPFQWMTDWASEEKQGVKFGVLGTVDSKNKAHTRTIAIRQINEWGILFFTQLGSEKVQHIKQNSFVSLTIYLPDSKRQIVVDGRAEALSDKENSEYWNTYPKDSQLRFMVYGPRAGEKIPSNEELNTKLAELRREYLDRTPKRPDAYVGYRISPEVIKFYQLNADELSDSHLFERRNGSWDYSRVVP